VKTIIAYHQIETNRPRSLAPEEASTIVVYEAVGRAIEGSPDNADMFIHGSEQVEKAEFKPALDVKSFPLHGLIHLVEKHLKCSIIIASYEETSEIEQIVSITTPADIAIRGDNRQADFFDMLRTLDEALMEISEHIRGINDPKMVDARLTQVRASAEAMRCYLDIDNGNGPEKLPRAAAAEVEENLKRIDWAEHSDRLQKWVKIGLDYLKLLLKDGGS